MAQILVVDDNAMMRTVMRAALERAGHNIVLAEGGDKALKAAAQSHFDLVITDIQMPGMTGVELVQALRKAIPDLKVLVISGQMEPVELHGMTSGKSLGVTASLDKPFTADKLVSKVAEILG